MSEAERLDAFVLGSEALAGRDPVGPAHRGALEDALRLGRAGEPCGAETLGAWCLALELGVAASALAELAGWLNTKVAPVARSFSFKGASSAVWKCFALSSRIRTASSS